MSSPVGGSFKERRKTALTCLPQVSKHSSDNYIMTDSQVSAKLSPIQTTLTNIVSDLKSMKASGSPTSKQLSPIQDSLRCPADRHW